MASSIDSRATEEQPAPAGRMPDFFVVGHAKSGTTALYRMLRQHPKVFMPELKEPWFFVPELRATGGRRRSVRHPKTWQEYLALFSEARGDELAGEATPSYLFSHEAAQRIAAAQPQARIIAVLREPASFLRSLHLEFLKTNVESVKDLSRALALESERSQGRALPANSTRPRMLAYSDHVRYVEQLERYHAVFPREQVLVLIYDDFRADNDGTVRTILRFLDLDDSVPLVPTDVNLAVGTRSPRMQELTRAVYMGRGETSSAVKSAIKTLAPQRLRHGGLAWMRRMQREQPPDPDERLTLELRRRFQPEVVALSDYLGRDLVGTWGYDRLG